MVRSVRRFLEPVGLDEPVVCYQGAAVVAADGEWLRHEPIELELAREAIAAVEAHGYGPNVYVRDELYVREETEAARDYANFQHLEIHSVGNLLDWLREPPTKLVCVGEPRALDSLEVRMKALLGDRLYISKSLPYFLEFAAPGVTKAAGLDFLAERMGFTPARGDRLRRRRERRRAVAWPGYGIAVENAHRRVKAVADWVCPSASEEGVAQVLESFLDSRG